jgi:hypothetical protein
MKQRSIIKVCLLEVITLGIYRLYYLIKTRREMMAFKPGIKILTPWFLLAPILVGVAAFIPFIIAVALSPSTTASSDSGSAVGLLAILTFYFGLFISAVLFIAWEWSYSQAVDKVTDSKLSFALSLLILILVPDGVDILIIQDYFNNLPPHTGAAHPTPVHPVPPAATAS